MEKITIHWVTNEDESRAFWQELYTYFERDLFPPGHPDREEDLEYFLGTEYRETVDILRQRWYDPLYFLLFRRGEETVGQAVAITYTKEDGDCFIMEFEVYPQFRGNGVGTACAKALFDWAAEKGAEWFRLNADGEERQRFWGRLGFVPDGEDEWGVPQMRRPGT